ncbi:MAG: histone deacetylase family protein [Alphaproteobacteria bacterium]|jgi:acetoin utilization deacetylase AcuC-like enzyme|nr:histone deacetylase family protein [Alphaproteobacteria bacterium]
MQVFYSEAHRQHAPESFITRGRAGTNPERPERAERLIQAVRADGHAVSAPNAFEHSHLAAVHTSDYLWFLEHGLAEWRRLPDAGPEIVANAHPSRYLATRPTGVVGLAGYHMADTACPIGEGTWPAAIASADCALSAAQAVRDGAAHAYALCRPPGHHAYGDLAGGFCFLNNVAIAAQYLASEWGRVAILDVDVHHGNGTQGIFYERADVYFASIHADPQAFYPYFAGYADERGVGPGEGFNLNLPLAPGSGDDVFLEALAGALTAIREAAPAALLVSLGLDAQANDPLGVLKVSTDGFARIAAAIAALGLPTVLVQEGGYLCDELGANLASFLAAFAETHRLD